MTRLAKLAGPLAIVAALSFASAPAKAQFGGMDDAQMQQFAPMLEMIKQKMGKRRFGQMMQMMGPMMMQMESQGGVSGLGGGFGGGMPMMTSGIDMGQIMSMVGSMRSLMGGRRGKARRR